jgi:hypothetical protein
LLAEVGDPAVVRPAGGRSDLRIADVSVEQVDRRKEAGLVDPLLGHHFEPGTRLEAPGQDFAPVDVVGDAPDDARRSRIDTEPVPLGEELAPRLAELADLEHAIAKRALGVLLPDPRRLADVPVGVEDVRHGTQR